MTPSNATIKQSGVDWLTMTTQKNSVGHKWYEIYRKYRNERLSLELKERPFHNGFYGGVSIGHLRWGYSQSLGYILILSGQDANLLFSQIKPVAGRVTRLDLCVDIALADSQALAQDGYKLLEAREKNLPKASLYTGTNNGATLYLGSRQSQQYGRLYDKGIEAGLAGAGLLWRFEVEYKKPLSGKVFDILKNFSPDRRAEVIRDTVIGWYRDRDITFLEGFREGSAMQIAVEKRVTTVDRKLAWLRTQVAPTVSQLISAGYGKDVLTSLLLDKRQLEQIYGQQFDKK